MWAELLKQALKLIVATVTSEGLKATPGLFGKLRAWWNGKCISIIGPTASGKNSLFNRLQKMKAPDTHIQTRGAEKVDSFTFDWPLPDKKRIKFKCKRSINVGGEIDERERFWLESCTDADVIFYLVDIQNLAKDHQSTIKRIKDDLKWLSSSILHMKAESCIQIFVNKIDTIISENDPSEISSKIENLISPLIDEIENIAKNILGSNFSKISGISPISMVDDHLFNRYFTHALQDVFKSQGSKK